MVASFTVTGFDEVERALLRREKTTVDAVSAMLDAGAAVLVKAQAAEITSTARAGWSIGTLAASIKAAPKVQNDTRSYIEVYPHGDQPHGTPGTGTRRSGKQKGHKYSRGGSKNVSNAQVGFIREYGTSSIPASPWMSTANEKCSPEVHEAMRKVWEEKQNAE